MAGSGQNHSVEGRRSKLAPLLRSLAKLPCARSVAARFVCALEGGQMWSETYRELLAKYYGVTVGLYTYGPCLRPGGLPEGTRVGRYSSLAAGIVVLRRNHPADRVSQHPFFFNADLRVLEADSVCAVHENPLSVGSDVWIGHSVIILPGCRRIGNGAVVAAGAVVTKDVDDCSVVGGVPARLLKWRFGDELRTDWLQSRWWDSSFAELRPELASFLGPAHSSALRRLARTSQGPRGQGRDMIENSASLSQ
jgi:virginiamycin A acetyltransferase